jgi:hypothetical protein
VIDSLNAVNLAKAGPTFEGVAVSMLDEFKFCCCG